MLLKVNVGFYNSCFKQGEQRVHSPDLAAAEVAEGWADAGHLVRMTVLR